MLLLAAALLAAPLTADTARPPGLGCPLVPSGAEGDPSTWCMELVPVPDLVAQVAGHAWLEPFDGPFGVTVTREGAYEHRLRVTIRGLPAPAARGGRRYVAWATTPLLTPMVRLGEVTNGETRLPPVTFPKFLVLVALEGARPDRAPGALVLRAMSPSAMLMPHGSSALPAREAAAHHHHGPWPMAPMHPQVPVMPPGLERLAPAVAPWRVEAGEAGEAGGQAVVALRDGDTLALDLVRVRRTVGGAAFGGFAFAANGGRPGVPGPHLVVPQGGAIRVRVRNALGEPTAVHWHGLRHDWRHDGAPGVSQPAVADGATWPYALRFPDAGLFWYHPHVREDRQQDLGLAGTILVRPARPDWLGPVAREEVLLLDDLLLDGGDVYPYGADTATHALMGRFGNTLLVNGQPRVTLRAEAGVPLRLWFANAAGTRTFNVVLDGAELKLVAADLGPLAREVRVPGVTIGPAERWAVDVRWPRPGRYAITNRVLGLNGFAAAYFADVDTLGVVEVEPGGPGGQAGGRATMARAFARLAARPAVAAEFGDLAAWRARPPDREILVTMRPGVLPVGLEQAMRLDTAYVAPVEWAGTMPMMDVLATARDVTWVLRDAATGDENHAIRWRARVGERLKLRLRNDRHTLHAMQHPIHLHGQRFLVLARNGVANPAPAWKDTALLPGAGTLDLLVEFTHPGQWMFHCHVPEHLATGMHTVIEVE